MPETMIAFLAVVSCGGVWNIARPTWAPQQCWTASEQIEPTMLIACEGVRYGGRELDRRGVVAQLRAARLPA